MHCLERYCTEKDPGLTCYCDCPQCNEANAIVLRHKAEQTSVQPLVTRLLAASIVYPEARHLLHEAADALNELGYVK